jgi:hypothetical protein
VKIRRGKMYTVLSEQGGLIRVRELPGDGDKFEVLDGSGRIIRIDNLHRLLKETAEARKEWEKHGMKYTEPQ